MTLLFLDGFDNYNSSARMTEKWDTVSDGYGAAPLSGGRTGGYFQGTNGFGGPRKIIAAGAHATWILGFALNRNGNGGQQDISFLSASGTRYENYFQISGNLVYAQRANNNSIQNSQTLLGNTVPIVKDTGWDYYEFLVTLSATVGVMQVRKNGVVVLNLTGVNNLSANSTIDAIEMQTFGGAPLYDDMYICNGAGSAPHNTFLGDCRVRQLLPSGAGSTTQFTASTGANYTTVDEVPANQTDYNAGTTDGNRDTYAMADLTDPTGSTIYGVQESIYAVKTDAGAKFVAPVVRSGGTDFVRASQALSTSYRQYLQLETVDPNTSAAWTVTNLNAAEFGAAAKDS